MDADLQLLHRYHRDGDGGAFRALMLAHAGMVFATARRITQDASLAEEVAQDTFLALAQRGQSIRESVAAWLHHIARQKACNVLRGELRRQQRESAASASMEIETESSWAELEPHVDASLDELSDDRRALLVEHFLEQRTQQELAQRRGISQATVSRQISDALHALRDSLRRRGVAAGVSLGALLTEHAAEAAPASLTATITKLAMSGVGVGTLSTLSLMTTTTKLVLAGTFIAMAAIGGYHLASPTDPKPRPPTTALAPAAPATLPTPAPQSIVSSTTTTPSVTSSKATGSAVVSSPQINLRTAAEYDGLMQRLFALRDPHLIVPELRRCFGLTLGEEDLRSMLSNRTVFEHGVLSMLASQYPREMVVWLASLDRPLPIAMSAVLPRLLEKHPEITADSIAAEVGPSVMREQVLSVLRAQQSPLDEANRFLTQQLAGSQRRNALSALALNWPKSRLSEGVAWAQQNLQGSDLLHFLPALSHELAQRDPAQAIALLQQTTDPELLSSMIERSSLGLVATPAHATAMLPLLDRLQGGERAFAIREIARRWIRKDQDAVLRWIDQIESSTDFDAALPLTLPQLSPANYSKAMTSLMSQLDAPLEAALISTAMSDLNNTSATATDIVRRLTALPQFRTLSSAGSGNQALLWQAVNHLASHWVKQHGGTVDTAMQWIDTLPFATPADKAAVVAKLQRP